MRRALLVLAIGAVGVIGAIGTRPVPAAADGPSEAPIVSPIQAGGILDEVWMQRETALTQRNGGALSSVEEGPALAYDLAWLDGTVSDRPGGNGKRGLIGQLALVPQQFAYPAFFIASTEVTTQPDPTGPYVYWTALVVVVRDDAGSPWRIRLESWASGPDTADQVRQVVGVQPSEQFASAWSGPTSTEEAVRRLSHSYLDLALQPLSPLDAFGVSLSGGENLLCFDRDYLDREDPPWWHPAKGAANDRRGIPEGTYQHLTATFQVQGCYLVEAATDGSPVFSLLTSQRAYVSQAETPASPPPWLVVGLIGCALCAGLFAVAWRLRMPVAKSASEEPEVIQLRAMERHTATTAGLRVLLVGLIGVEVERWLLPRSPWLAIVVAGTLVYTAIRHLPPQWRTLRFTGRILIKQPIAEVFAFVRDLRNEPKWQPLVTSVEQIDSPGPEQVYRARQRIGPAILLEYEAHITEPAGERVVAWSLAGKWFPERAEWRFVEVPEGTVVTLARWFELGPLRAMAFGVKRYRESLRRMTLDDLNALNRTMAGETPAEAPDQIPDREISREYAWMRRLPSIGQSDIAVSICSFLGCWLLYRVFTTEWFAAGVMLMLLVHELGHYVEFRRVGMKPRPPVFVLFGAFVYATGRRIDALAHSRVSLAGGLAGGMATALALVVAATTGSSNLIAWAEAGAAANLFGSLMPFITVDVEAVLMVVGKWLPVVGLFAAASAWAAATALGMGDLLIPLIVFLAFVVLRRRYPGRRQPGGSGLSTTARLVIAGTWLMLVAYLSVVFFLTAGWLN